MEEDLLHIRWCPTGPFNFLPIHAATEYDPEDQVLDRLSKHVVSSYIPTIHTLLDSKRKSTSPVDCKTLVVLQPTTPGQAKLPGVDEELEVITQQTKKGKAILNYLYDKEATVDTVLKAVPEYSVVHFACHGVQDADNPLRSGLLLQDGRLSLEKLIPQKLPNAQLAFLSACETSKGEKKQPDEAIHIAAGMLAAGFRDVIGTMWSIYDAAGPIVADRVYREILEDGKLRVDRIPFALHHAVEHIRAMNPNNFMFWMPFIHLGP